MSATERLFLAQDLPGPLRATLGTSLAFQDSWRPTPPENLHLTLFFAGSLPQHAWRERIDALAQVAGRHGSFTLHSGVLHLVQGKDRMAWLRFAPHPAFDALHADLARAFGLPPDPRSPHWPHITLARTGIDAPLPQATQDLPQTLEVEALTLVRSEPGEGRPRYVPLLRLPLQNSSS